MSIVDQQVFGLMDLVSWACKHIPKANRGEVWRLFCEKADNPQEFYKAITTHPQYEKDGH